MKQKILFLLILFLGMFIVSFAQTSDWIWARSNTGGADTRCSSVTSDNSGNIYATGRYGSDSVSFGTYSFSNNGFDDIFVVKYDVLGNVIWARTAGSTSWDHANSIITDDSGNVYVTGDFQSTITFGNDTLSGAIFIVKYDSSGNIIWVHSAGSGLDSGASLKKDNLGNIYLAGELASASATFGSFTIINSSIIGGGADAFIVKYTPTGNVLWAQAFGGGNSCVANVTSVTTDNSGNIGVCGCFVGSSITIGSFTLYNVNPTFGYNDFFIAKFDSGGNAIWAKSAGGTDFDYAASITSDPSGSFHITGMFISPSVIFENDTLHLSDTQSWITYGDTYVVKYDSSGTELWAKSAQGNYRDWGYSICADATGNVFLTGYFDSNILVIGNDTLANPGFYVAKYDPNGNVLMAKGGYPYLHCAGSAITIDNSGSVIIGGFFSQLPATFGADTLYWTGMHNMFVAKLTSTVGVEETFYEKAIMLYPNPSNGIFTVKNVFIGNIEINIFNSIGQEVYNIEKTEGEDFQIDLKDNPSGIYFVSLISEGKKYNAKLIKD